MAGYCATSPRTSASSSCSLPIPSRPKSSPPPSPTAPTPKSPGLQDVGDIHLRAPGATGYIRVDWFTPAGLPTWGDGRLTILGTEGYIELRKYVDIAGRPGADHLFLVDAKGMQHVDCSGVSLPYARQLIADIRNRTETAMSQAHCFKAMELALQAQELAERNNGAPT